jgi:hypothetical protein
MTSVVFMSFAPVSAAAEAKDYAKVMAPFY